MMLQTVVETEESTKQVKGCLDDKAREEFNNYIAANPLAGSNISGTGGARKIRWQSIGIVGRKLRRLSCF
jgi:hypothetical protein